MKNLYQWNKIFGLALILVATMHLPAQAKNLFNVTLVAPPQGIDMQAFYMRIFEVSCREALTVNPNDSCKNWGFETYKPARLTYNQAVQFCQSRGMRLPTVNEWYGAAKNFDMKRAFSSISGQLRGPDGRYLFNIKGDGRSRFMAPTASGTPQSKVKGTNSINPYRFEELGIDIWGTVGMTGNRAEWTAQDGSGNVARCGGGYRATEAQLSSALCEGFTLAQATANQKTGTARCVSNFDSNDKVFLIQEQIRGDLQAYVGQIYTNLDIAVNWVSEAQAQSQLQYPAFSSDIFKFLPIVQGGGTMAPVAPAGSAGGIAAPKAAPTNSVNSPCMFIGGDCTEKDKMSINDPDRFAPPEIWTTNEAPF